MPIKQKYDQTLLPDWIVNMDEINVNLSINSTDMLIQNQDQKLVKKFIVTPLTAS